MIHQGIEVWQVLYVTPVDPAYKCKIELTVLKIQKQQN